MTYNDMQRKLFEAVHKDGMALEKIPGNLKSVELCVTALKQCQNPKCFVFIPEGIRKEVKIAAGCYDYYPPRANFISSLYRKA